MTVYSNKFNCIKLQLIYSKVGNILLKNQRLEFLIQGMIAHFSSDFRTGNKEFKPFKKLTPTVFFSNKKEDQDARRFTLGHAIKAIKGLSFEFKHDLDEFLQERNKFTHNLWRDYLKDGNYDGCIEFLDNFDKNTDYWIKVFGGFYLLFYKTVYDKSTEEYKQKHVSILEKLENQYSSYIDTFYESIDAVKPVSD